MSIDPKQGSVFLSGHEQEARDALDHRGVEQGRRPQISDGKKISTGSERQKLLREAKRYQNLLETKKSLSAELQAPA